MKGSAPADNFRSLTDMILGPSILRAVPATWHAEITLRSCGVIIASRFSSVICDFSRTPMLSPSRKIVARSAMRTSSAIRCVTIKIVAPSDRKRSISVCNREVASRSSAAEDSSRIRTLGQRKIARAITIHCFTLRGNVPTSAFMSTG
ncbi:hypothetical protein D3C72_1310900 [compost metagenome]